MNVLSSIWILISFGIIAIGLSSCKQYVKFETTIHKEDVTKDGIYLNDYVVNIDYDRILLLDNERVIIKGRYSIVKGLDQNDTIVKQGRTEDSKHILRPRIRKIKSN